MEVLGAVASSVAVVQALAAGKQIVSMVREIPEIQGDWYDLKRELDIVGSIVKLAEQQIRSSPAASLECDLITQAAGQLHSIVKELNDVLQGCVRETKEGDKKIWKAKRRKWLLEGSKIKKLEQKMQSAKSTLHFAVMSKGLSADAEFRAKAQMFMNFSIQMLKSHPPIEKGRTKELSDVASTTDSDEISVRREQELIAFPGPQEVRAGDSVQLTRSIVSRSAYSRNCRCRCHFSESSYQSSGWLQSLLGSYLVRCRDLPGRRRKACSSPDCICRESGWLRFDYQVPKWFLAGALSFQASYTSLTGLTCSLRPTIMIDFTLGIWRDLGGPTKVAQQAIMQTPFHPNDHNSSGVRLMDYAISWGLFDGVEALLCEWESILPDVGLSRSVLYRANERLQHWDTSDGEEYLLRKVIGFVKDRPETTTTEVHEAICRGEGLQEALSKEPWAVNIFDCTGRAPLHLAAGIDQAEDVEALIDAHADVNRPRYDGSTPLIVAAASASVDSAKVLLQAKCTVDHPDQEGATALHYAAKRNSPELVRLLLRVGASATTLDNTGRTPLHYLALDSTTNPDNLQGIMGMLIQAEADIDALDDTNFTPLLLALIKGNVLAVRCLVDAGCSLSPVDVQSRNILHFATYYSRLETLQLLADLDFSGINPYLQDNFGCTPWDRFILAVSAPAWALGTSRRPNPAEQEAFIRLYQDVRDQNLQHDLDRLEHVLGSLLDQDAVAAEEHLAPLIHKEQEWKRHDLVNWYRAVDKRIQHKEFSLALDDVTQYLDDLRAELNTPVWETPCRWGFIRPPMYQDDDDDWVTEEEGSELELSDDEDLPETSTCQFRDESEDDLEKYISETDAEGIESEFED